MALSLSRKRVLIVDMDPQAKTTAWLGAGDGLTSEGTLVEVLGGGKRLKDIITPSRFGRLHVAPSAQALEDVSRLSGDDEDFYLELDEALSSVASQYDYVVIDSPNQISPLMVNAIMPADYLHRSNRQLRCCGVLCKLLQAACQASRGRLLQTPKRSKSHR